MTTKLQSSGHCCVKSRMCWTRGKKSHKEANVIKCVSAKVVPIFAVVHLSLRQITLRLYPPQPPVTHTGNTLEHNKIL